MDISIAPAPGGGQLPPLAPLANLKGSGNRCGHEPDAPKWWLKKPFSVEKAKGSEPKILKELAERVLQYYATPKKIPSLNMSNNFDTPREQAIRARQIELGVKPKRERLVNDRQQRSERREACVLLLVVMIRNLDLATLRVGHPSPNGFINYDLNWLATQCGLSLSRAKRALRDIRTSNLLTSKQARRVETDAKGNTVYRGMAAAKAVNKQLFSMFGLSERLRYERKRATKRLRKKIESFNKKADKTTRTARARTSAFVGALAKQAGTAPIKKPKKQYSPPPGRAEAEAHRQMTNRAIQLKIKDPTLSTEQAYTLAKEQLGV